MEFVISFNLNRRHLTITQKVELGLTILKMEMEKARRRQGTRTDLTSNKEEDNNIPSKLKESEEEQGEATEIAAKKVGLGKDTLWTAQGRIPLFLVRTTGAQKQINPHLTYPLIFSLAAPEAVVFNKGQQ